MKVFLHKSLIILVLLFIIGCGGTKPKAVEYDKKSDIEIQNHKEIEDSFAKVNTQSLNYSKWFDRNESVELNLVGPVYKNITEKQSKSYKMLETLLEKVSQDPSLLDKLSNSNISKRYSKINYIPYKLGSDADAKFSVVYNQRLDAKDKISNTLQELDEQGKDKLEQTLAIWINPDDVKNNIYTLEGYKTIKTTSKNRNSSYYHLSKVNSNGEDKQEVINAFLAILELSIPNYEAIDRKEMLKDGENFRIITDNPNGTATGKVYKFEINDEIEKLEAKKTQTTDAKEKARLDEEIKAVIASKDWREYETKQLLYTEPVNQKTIDTLNKYAYLKTNYIFNQLSTAQGKEVAQIFNYALPDTFLLTQFSKYKTSLNSMEINIGDIKKIGKAYYIRGLANTESEKSARSSASMVNGLADTAEGVVYATTLVLSALGGGGGQGIMLNLNDELTLVYVDEPEQKTFLYPTSNTGSSNIVEVFNHNYKSMAHSYKTWEIDDRISKIFEFSLDGAFLYWSDGEKLHIKKTKSSENFSTIDAKEDIVKAFISTKHSKVFVFTDEPKLLAYDFSGKLIKEIGLKGNAYHAAFGDDYSIVATYEKTGLFSYITHAYKVKTDDLSFNKYEKGIQPGNSFRYIPKVRNTENGVVYVPNDKDTSVVVVNQISSKQETIFEANSGEDIVLLTDEHENSVFSIVKDGFTQLYVYDKNSNEKIDDYKIDGIEIAEGFCNTSTGYCVFIEEPTFSGLGNETKVYNLKSKKIEAKYPGFIIGGAFKNSEQILIIDGEDIMLLRLKDMRNVHTFSEHTAAIAHIKYKNGMFASQSIDGSVKLWDISFLDITEKEY